MSNGLSNGSERERERCVQIEARHPGWACWANLFGDWLARTVGTYPMVILRITAEAFDTAEERAEALEQAIAQKEADFGPVQ